MDELRIVVFGKQGVGKSATGNTLLGKNTFHTAVSSQRVTQACVMGMSTVDNQNIKVIDTPGWSDSSLSETEIKQEILKCIHMSSPGPHVFLLVLPIGRFTNEEINTVMNILEEFGDEVNKYMIVLFTRGDDLEERSIEDYLEEVHPHLKKLIQICGGRYHVFNNRDKQNHTQVSSFLQKIKHMVEGKEGKYYTKTMYQKAKDQQIENGKRQETIGLRDEQYRKEDHNPLRSEEMKTEGEKYEVVMSKRNQNEGREHREGDEDQYEKKNSQKKTKLMHLSEYRSELDQLKLKMEELEKKYNFWQEIFSDLLEASAAKEKNDTD